MHIMHLIFLWKLSVMGNLISHHFVKDRVSLYFIQCKYLDFQGAPSPSLDVPTNFGFDIKHMEVNG